MSRLNESCA